MDLETPKRWLRPLAGESEVERIDPFMRLSRCAAITPTFNGGIIESFDAVWRTCSFDPGYARLATSIWQSADGVRTASEIAQSIGFDVTSSLELIQSFYEHGLLVNSGDSPVPPLSFHDHAVSIGRTWMANAFVRSRVSELSSENANRRILVAYLLDRYHYISSAASHISRAIAKAPNDRLRFLLSQHLSEEFWHGAWMKDGLLAAGFTEHQIDESLPLPATLGAMCYLQMLADTDTLGYFVTIGVRESHPTDNAESERQVWDRWVQEGIVPEAVIAPFRDHQLLDMAEDHAELSAEAFVGLPWLVKDQQTHIFRVLSNFSRLTVQSALAIFQYCEDSRNPVPFQGLSF